MTSPARSKRRRPRRRTTTDAAGTVIDEDFEDEPDTGPQRRCIVTREHGDRARMLRFVLGPGRQVVPDLMAKLPGRGMWLSARRDVLETARMKNAFARAARAPVVVPPDLLDIVEAGLVRRVSDLIGLARRAGQANYGFERSREWLQKDRVGIVIQAKDGSAEEKARFLSGRRHVAVAAPLPAATLGAVFGRDHVVHVVVAPGRLAETLKLETDRLAGIAGLGGGMEQAE